MKASTATAFQKISLWVTLVPAVLLIGIWSLGISAVIRKKFDPAVPQWILAGAMAALIVGIFILIGRFMRSRTGQRFSRILMTCLLIPLFATVVAMVFGGAYWWLSGRLAREREPAATSILAAGLGVTVLGFGMAVSMERGHMMAVLAISLTGLGLMRTVLQQGPMGMLRFGALHGFTLFLAMAAASMEDEQRRHEALTLGFGKNSVTHLRQPPPSAAGPHGSLRVR